VPLAIIPAALNAGDLPQTGKVTMEKSEYNLAAMAAGNPGAMAFLAQTVNSDVAEEIMPVLNDYGIKGTNLYVLWSDLCNKDLLSVAILCEKCPKDVLIDACSRQDYSGRALVAEYLA
jgi:hypothetical protein